MENESAISSVFPTIESITFDIYILANTLGDCYYKLSVICATKQLLLKDELRGSYKGKFFTSRTLNKFVLNILDAVHIL